MLHTVLVLLYVALQYLICTEKVPLNSPESRVMGLAVLTGTGLLTSEQPSMTCKHGVKNSV
jgi:hypothetical protein